MTREIRSFAYGREYIPTTMAGSETCRLLVVTDDQIEILRSLVNYAHQRRSWNDETIDDARYYLPSDEDWDVLEALVADLEDRLMSQCDFVTLDDTNNRLGVNEETPDHALVVVGDPIARLQDAGETMGLVLSEGDALLDAGDSIQVTAPTIILEANLTKIRGAGGDPALLHIDATAGKIGLAVGSPNSLLDIGAGAITLAEMTPPGGTPANMCVLFVKDDGTGKTALIAKFNSVSRVLATE